MSALRRITEKLRKWIIELLIALVVVIAMFVLYQYFSSFNGAKSTDQAVWGQFGDFVGGTLNPILGFVSVLILAVTLNLQRVELRESRNTALANNSILEKQLATMHAQSLESTFFKLLEEFKGDAVARVCSSADRKYDVYYSIIIYLRYRDSGLLGPKGRLIEGGNSLILFASKGAVNKGDFDNLVFEKVLNLIELASSLPNNWVHLSLVKSVVGGRLLAALINYAYTMDSNAYAILLKGRTAFQGIRHALIDNEVIAKDILTEKMYKRYSESKVENENRLNEWLDKYIASLGATVIKSSM